MKVLACRDLGMECDYVGKAESADELVNMMVAHGMAEHADQLAGADIDQMKEMMMTKMTEE